MSEIVAYCGLICHTCPIYVATRQDDGAERARMRTEIALLLNERYTMQVAPEDITACDGCPSEAGRLFFSCQDCSIRPCARQKGVQTCASCSEYACEKLVVIFATEPMARTRLDEIRIRGQ